mmetsp:Transcript_53335/g.173437  ORF Transcript_53335/g.173437 Transcript_53335/m.173437 type:complete len:804 (-) Transcript_53335:570-2981(-)
MRLLLAMSPALLLALLAGFVSGSDLPSARTRCDDASKAGMLCQSLTVGETLMIQWRSSVSISSIDDGASLQRTVMQDDYHTTERVVQVEGNTVAQLGAVPVDSCMSACDANAACSSFAYGSGRCYLKDKCVSSLDPIVSSSADNSHFKTYYKLCGQVVDKKAQATEVRPQPYSVTERVVEDEGAAVGSSRAMSVEQCEFACDANSACSSFAYGSGMCYLKDRCLDSSAAIVSPQAANSHFKTYYKCCLQECLDETTSTSAPEHIGVEAQFYLVTERVVQNEGSDVGMLEAGSVERCKLECDANFDCKSVAYGNGKCYLKDKCVVRDDPIVSASAGNSHFKTYYKPCGQPDAGVQKPTTQVPAVQKISTQAPAVHKATAQVPTVQQYIETYRVLQDEGSAVGSLGAVSLDQCKVACDANSACMSVAYGDGKCYLKGKCVSSSDAIVSPNAQNSHFKTYYKPCEQATTQGNQLDSASKAAEVPARVSSRLGMNLHYWRKSDSAEYMRQFYLAGIRRFRVWHADCWGACTYATLQQASGALADHADVKFQVTLMKPDVQADDTIDDALATIAGIVQANGHGISSVQIDHVGINPSESELCLEGFGPGHAAFNSVVERVFKVHARFPEAVISLPWQQVSDEQCWGPFIESFKSKFGGAFPVSLMLGFHVTIYPFLQDGLSTVSALDEIKRGSQSGNNFNKLQERVELDFNAVLEPARAVAVVSEIGWASSCGEISRMSVSQKATQANQCAFLENIAGTDWPAEPNFEVYYFAGWPYEGWGDGSDCSSSWSPFTPTQSLCNSVWALNP